MTAAESVAASPATGGASSMNRETRSTSVATAAGRGGRDYLQAVADELSNRTRAIRGFKKPKEVFAEPVHAPTVRP